jgi:hypothetical protein
MKKKPAVAKKKKSYYIPKKKTPKPTTKKKQKSYYVPVAKRKAAEVKKPTTKKKYKSYYKPKKKAVIVVEESSSKVLPHAIATGMAKPIASQSKNVPVKPKRPVKYLNNRDLLAEVIKSKVQGTMSNELAKMLTLLCSRYAKKGNWSGYCVDTETQALTKRGWLFHNEITTDDIILSHDISTGNLTWSKVLNIYTNNYAGKMHKLTTQGMDALVTPNHKFVSTERGIIPVEDIICNEHIVLMGKSIEDINQISKFTDDEVRVIGWAVTGGHYLAHSKKKHAITIYQKEGLKADKIRKCLSLSNTQYSEHTSRRNNLNLVGFRCSGPFITEIYNSIAPKRVLSMDMILNLTKSQRQILIETMVAGDGWLRPNNAMSYVQKDKHHIEAFRLLCTLCGIRTSISKYGFKTPSSVIHPEGTISECHIMNLYTESKQSCKAESIDFHGGKQSAGGREQKPNLPTVEYNDIVWCPTTEYGTFVCRRNNTIYVTGNSYNEDMQGYAMMMLVKTWKSFDPAKSSNPFAFFTQCLKSSFIQTLNSEKRQRDIKDATLVNSGLSPSYNYQYEYTGGDSAEPVAESENVDLPSKPSHNIDLFEAGAEDHQLDEAPSSDAIVY